MRMSWHPPAQDNLSLDPVREEVSRRSRITVAAARDRAGAPAFMWLKISLVDGPASLEVYVDNGELFYSVDNDEEWGIVPAGSRELQVEFLTERLDARAVEAKMSSEGGKRGGGVRSASAWKTTRRGTDPRRYHVPPQSLDDFSFLREALTRLPGSSLSETHLKKSRRDSLAFQFEVDGLVIVVAFAGDNIFYLVPSVRERGDVPVGSVSLQVQLLLERARAAVQQSLAARGRGCLFCRSGGSTSVAGIIEAVPSCVKDSENVAGQFARQIDGSSDSSVVTF